jgi:hypothetical protein
VTFDWPSELGHACPGLPPAEARREKTYHGGPNRIARDPVKGRMIVAVRDYKPRQLIEVAPVITFPRRTIRMKSTLGFYVYEWNSTTLALAFGQGSLYNHSYTPNARYQMDRDALVLRYYAHKAIRAGEEITTNYLFDPKGRGSVGFSVTP